MTTEAIEQSDALVIGGNTAGLAVAYLLGQYGYRTRVLERSPLLGGVDRSFQNSNGRTFDHGLHVMEYMRSEFVTRLFLRAVNGEVNKVERKRGIVLRNHVGLSYGEIAAALGLASDAQVRALFSRALAALARGMDRGRDPRS